VATIGVDLGGTKVLAARVDDGGEIEATEKVATPGAGLDAVVSAIVGAVEGVGGTDGVTGLGVGAPGVVDVRTGVVVRAPNLAGFEQPVPLASLLAERLGLDRVVVDNDVNAATLAEHRLGAGRGASDLVGVFVGTGVGGGLVLDGRLRRGPGGLAGEIGHLVVHLGGRRCGCGHLGHLEAYAGRGAMEVEARRRHAAGEETRLVDLADGRRMKSGVWRDAIDQGDPLAVELLDEAVAALGAAIASVVHLVDLELVVVGGGLADKLGPSVVGRIEEAARSRLFVPSQLRVLPAALGDDAGIRGAALLPDELAAGSVA
jgi:glucokinase